MGAIRRLLYALTAPLLAHGYAAASAEPMPDIAGQSSIHIVRQGEFLIRIASRFGVSEKVIARDNGLGPPYLLRIGDRLRIDNRHIVPEALEDGMVINIPQRMLFLFRRASLIGAYPVGLGRPDWRTPTGSYYVTKLEQNKTWCVPKSIQEEMRREGRSVVTRVPPGPDNPLGEHWIGLSIPGYGIHSTIAPASIYRVRTHGCIRLHPEDAAAVYGLAFAGMPVKIIYAPVLLARLADGRIVAEVNPDVYNRGGDPLHLLRERAAAHGMVERIDWTKAAEVARAKDGVARDVRREISRETTSGRKVFAQVEYGAAKPPEMVWLGSRGQRGATACDRPGG